MNFSRRIKSITGSEKQQMDAILRQFSLVQDECERAFNEIEGKVTDLQEVDTSPLEAMTVLVEALESLSTSLTALTARVAALEGAS